MCMVKVLNQLGEVAGRVTSDRDDAVYSQWGGHLGTYPAGSWDMTTARRMGYSVLSMAVEGIWQPIGIYATVEEATAAHKLLSSFIYGYKNAPAPAEIPTIQAPARKAEVDAYAVYKDACR